MPSYLSLFFLFQTLILVGLLKGFFIENIITSIIFRPPVENTYQGRIYIVLHTQTISDIIHQLRNADSTIAFKGQLCLNNLYVSHADMHTGDFFFKKKGLFNNLFSSSNYSSYRLVNL